MADEEKRGELKVTVDIEVNEDMMKVMEKTLTEVPKEVAERVSKS